MSPSRSQTAVLPLRNGRLDTSHPTEEALQKQGEERREEERDGT
jgi:hypothetical protein